MYLKTEMPCLHRQMLDGRIVIRNNGDEDIKLQQGPVLRDLLVHSQLYIRMDVTEEEEMRISARPATRWMKRFDIKESTEYEIQEGGNFVTVKKGETFEVDFSTRQVTVPHGAGNKRVTMVAELYLSPDKWIPVEIRPPLVVAGDEKTIGITSRTRNKVNEPWVYRINIDTNSVLYMAVERTGYDLADLNLDDVVTHSNKVITITQKDGKVRTILEADIPRISAERTEGKRKARDLQFQKLLHEKK